MNMSEHRFAVRVKPGAGKQSVADRDKIVVVQASPDRLALIIDKVTELRDK